MTTKPTETTSSDKSSDKYEFQTRLPTEEEKKTVRPYSNSILSAVNTCPMWGVIHYGKRKSYNTDARSMALEYGSVAHDLFAACYLWQVGHIQHLPEHMHYHSYRIFGDDRFSHALDKAKSCPSDEDQLLNICFDLLRASDFYDDPTDFVRTHHNLEMGMMKYIENVYPIMPKYPILITDEKDPTADIGVEMSVDFMIEKLYDKDTQPKQSMRFIGQADRVHQRPDGEIILGENKTGARLGEAWALSFDMANQITGYLLGLSTRFNQLCTKSRVHGLKTKQTGSAEDFNPISPLDRTPEMFENFMSWALHSHEMYERYVHDYEKAPRYTHSCNRYFRPCSLITFCCDNAEGRVEQLEQMVETSLSPSEIAVMDKYK